MDAHLRMVCRLMTGCARVSTQAQNLDLRGPDQTPVQKL